MRQAGAIASFGLMALEPKWIKRLEEDHENAKMLAEGIRNLGLNIEVHTPETNILIVEFLGKTRSLKVIRALGDEGILAFNIDKKKIRFVTHYGIDADDIQYSIERIGYIFKKILT